MMMTFKVPPLLFVGLIIVQGFLQCQTQGSPSAVTHGHGGPTLVDPTIMNTRRHSHPITSGDQPRPGMQIADIHGNQPPHAGGIHVDLPFEHGNNQLFPVLHHGSNPITGTRWTAVGTNVDRSVHTPSVHRPTGRGTPPPGPVGHMGHTISSGLADVHVDRPGVHGNNMPVPVVHRPSVIGQPMEHGRTGVHVDHPGMHGNTLPIPVVHRPSGIGPPVAPGHLGHSGATVSSGIADVHVDRPGTHGNTLHVPVVHRPSAQIHSGQTGVHVDRPGMHGNILSIPVVHRPSGIGHPVNSGQTGVHVDRPGMHGNNLNIHVIHRPSGLGQPTGISNTGVQINRPGVRETSLSVRANQMPSGTGAVVHSGFTGVHVARVPFRVFAQPSDTVPLETPTLEEFHPIGPPVRPGHIGVHVDHPGVHGNTLRVPVVHRPSNRLPQVRQSFT